MLFPLKKNATLLLSILLCWGCGQSSQEIVTEEIHAQRLEQINDPFYVYGSIFLDESAGALLKSEARGNVVIKRLDLRTGTCTDLIRKGRGPNEYLDLAITDIEPETGKFHAISRMTSKSIAFSADGTPIATTTLETRFLNTISLGRYIVSYGNYFADDGLLFQLSDSTGRTIGRFGPFPDDGMPYEHQYKTMAYQGTMVANPQRSRFAYLMDFGNVFDIYEITDDGSASLIFSIHEDTPVYEPQQNVIGVRFEQPKFHYSDAYASQRYIYALYSGKKVEQKTDEASQRARETPTIRVYDWDGNRICDLSADIPLLSICVSSDDSYLIGLYSEDYVLKCCRFDLPERLRE